MHIKTVDASEAKAHFSSLLDSAANGTKFIITRKEHPIAVLMPYQKKDNKNNINSTIQALLKFRKGRSLENLSVDDLKRDTRKH